MHQSREGNTFFTGLEGVNGFPWTVFGRRGRFGLGPPWALYRLLSKQPPPLLHAPHGLTIFSRAFFLMSCSLVCAVSGRLQPFISDWQYDPPFRIQEGERRRERGRETEWGRSRRERRRERERERERERAKQHSPGGDDELTFSRWRAGWYGSTMYSGAAPRSRMSKGYPAGAVLGAPTVKFLFPSPGRPFPRKGRHSVVREIVPRHPSRPPAFWLWWPQDTRVHAWVRCREVLAQNTGRLPRSGMQSMRQSTPPALAIYQPCPIHAATLRSNSCDLRLIPVCPGRVAFSPHHNVGCWDTRFSYLFLDGLLGRKGLSETNLFLAARAARFSIWYVERYGSPWKVIRQVCQTVHSNSETFA